MHTSKQLMPVGDACLSHMSVLTTSVPSLHRMPITVNVVADTCRPNRRRLHKKCVGSGDCSARAVLDCSAGVVTTRPAGCVRHGLPQVDSKTRALDLFSLTRRRTQDEGRRLQLRVRRGVCWACAEPTHTSLRRRNPL
jgi:hypothetical protein